MTNILAIVIRTSLLLSLTLLCSCNTNQTKLPKATSVSDAGSSGKSAGGTCVIGTDASTSAKVFDKKLPTIGVLVFDDVLMTEVTAPIDVFSKPSEAGKPLFNVILIARRLQPVVCDSGLRILPDRTFDDCPKLDVIVVPSSYDMSERVKDIWIIDFIKQQNTNTKFTMSNCGGAQLIGESGIAKGKKIVTYIGGGEDLQKAYPELAVQDDGDVTYVEDGKFLSSNGNLASYISALKLLEKMTSKKHRDFVESYLYLERLKNWNE